jgi:hypothetical protein
MVNRNLLRQFDLADDELQLQLAAAFAQGPGSDVDHWLPTEKQAIRDFRLVTGHVRTVSDGAVWVDVGYKSEGVIELREW